MSNYIEQPQQDHVEKRIVGVFTKQAWGGRKGDDAIFVGEEQFDATDAVLKLSHAELIELQDNYENTDEIGRSIVGWDGPCEVRLVGSIQSYFGVESIEDVTPAMLAQAVLEHDGELSNYIEQAAASQDKAVDLKNTLGQVATAPFYIWANDDCANKANNFKEAKAIRLTLFNEGGESVHIVDADGVEVVDAEIEAHEALVNAGYFAGARKPEVKPEFHGAFMVNDPQDSEGFAIVGDDIASLILEARDRLIEPASEREMSNYIEHSASGKTGTFAAKYDQHAERNGQTFTVLGAVDPKTYDATECGEMFSIRFADGVQIDAWPEEVESAMNEARLVNNDEEVVVKLADGCTLRSGVYDPHKEGALTSGEYVRLCDPDGEEILYWDQEEWANDPALVMGAIMNAAAGLRVHHVDSPSPGM